MSNATPTEVVRLSPDMMAKLEQQLRPPITTATTTPIEAGEIIGIQRVLKILREGWVIGR